MEKGAVKLGLILLLFLVFLLYDVIYLNFDCNKKLTIICWKISSIFFSRIMEKNHP